MFTISANDMPPPPQMEKVMYGPGHQEHKGSLSLFQSERFQIPRGRLRKFLRRLYLLIQIYLQRGVRTCQIIYGGACAKMHESCMNILTAVTQKANTEIA